MTPFINLPGQMPAGFQLHGHRGARAEMPENTIPAMLHALDQGCNWLETDVVATSDSHVVLSHEPWINPEICTLNGGQLLGTHFEHNIFNLTLEQTQRYDCGSSGHPRFPNQARLPVAKPTLAEMFRAVETHRQANLLPPCGFNIEIKAQPDWDGAYTPDYEVFADLVVGQIEAAGMASRCVLQCFDERVLKYLHRRTRIPVSYLNERPETVADGLGRLGFQPRLYSPYFKHVTAQMVAHCHAMGILIVPWTVNKPAQMRKLMQLGVDGIISDEATLLVKTYAKWAAHHRP